MFARFYTVVLLLCLLATYASAKPKRFTCEFGGDAGCGAHCVGLGRTGGWCGDHNYCYCKQETLWEKITGIFGKRSDESV